MESPILKQIAKFLQDKKRYKRWLAVFVCLAVIVGFTTAAALKMRGRAMTHDERVLACKLEVHQHTEACYDQEKNIICGYADYAVHRHNEDCYDAKSGSLACTLPEVEAHQHTDACYQEAEALACGLEESEGHQHTDGCYTREQGELTCQAEEHAHTEECQGEDGTIICEKEEHTHTDECYEWDEALACQQEESEGHTHTAECYQVQKTLVCQKPEVKVHTHGDGCYERVLIAPDGQETVQDPEGNVGIAEKVLAGTANEELPEGRIEVRRICGKLQVEEHTHTQENGCIEIHEVIDGTDLNPVEDNLENGDGKESAQTNWDGMEKSDLGEADENLVKTFEGNGFTVTATYKKDANIPDEAGLLVEQITAESDEEHYAKRSEEFQEMMEDKNATMSALLKVGFYLNGQEIEPETPVTLTVQFLGEDGLPEGAPITVVHFAEEGNEELEGSDVEDGSTTFKMDSFSEIAIGIGEKNSNASASTVSVSKSYEYKGDMFHAVFRVEGNVELPDDSMAGSDGNIDKKGKQKDKEATEKDVAEKTELVVKLLDEKADEYKAAAAIYSDDTESAEELYMNQVLSYSLVYNDKKLDLSDCKVTMEVTPTQKLLDYADATVNTEAESDTDIQPEAMLSFIGISNTESIDEDGQGSVGRADIDIEEDVSNPSEDIVIEGEEGDAEIEGVKTENAGTEGANSGMADEESDSADGTGIEDSGSAEEGNDLELSTEDIPQKGEILATAPITNATLKQPVTVILNAAGTQNAVAAAVTSQANPKFTVELYAEIEKIVATDLQGPITDEEKQQEKISVIDTSGKSMPTNGGNMDRKRIAVKKDGTLETTTELTEVYTPEEYEYISAPGLLYFNKIAKNDSYELTEIRVKRQGTTEWETYPCVVNGQEKEWHFTNKQATKDENEDDFILITDKATIRLVHKVRTETVRNGASFYDYDVSDGKLYNSASATESNKVNRGNATTPSKSAVWYMYTNRQGINSNLADQTFGFGNSEGTLKTTMGEIVGNWANAENAGYGSPTFGLVTGLNNGKIQYASNIKAPNLFNDGDAKGKSSYIGNLVFSQKGDTYTLTGAEVMEGKQVVSAVNGVDKFKRQRLNWNKTYYFAGNDFYPMDGVSSAGTDGHDLMFGDASTVSNLKNFSDKDNTLDAPASDDGQNHNHYFGMHYTVSFDLVKDYSGPLEYLFYGDDDMWVFLDGPEGSGLNGKLVCDIGGVHSSVGEYVNLWDYVKKDNETVEGRYTLTFFYTERGASGSTCWMQFTLPSVSFATTEQDTGQIKIEKEVTGSETSDEFGFNINFQKKNGQPLKDDYSYTKYNSATNEVIENDVLIWNNSKFTLKAGEYIIINFLPVDSTYTLKEVGPVEVKPKEPGEDLEWTVKPDNPYIPEISGGNSTGTLGEITGDVIKNDTIRIKYNNVEQYVLPETGGFGTNLYTMAGVLSILFGAGFMYRKKFREGRVGGSS